MNSSLVVNAEHPAKVNAAALVALARMAYDDEVTKVEGWPNCERFFDLGAHGLVVWNDDDLVIAIAGTDDPSDVTDDLDVRVTKTRGVEVHRGFYSHTRRVVGALNKITYPRDRRIWLTGHSLGGAVAQILPIDLRWMMPHMVVTFGSPRVFAKQSAATATIEHRTINLAAAYDVVPLYPPIWFCHSHAPIILHGPGDIRIGRFSWSMIWRAVRRFCLAMGGRYWGWGLAKSVRRDHSIEQTYEVYLKPFRNGVVS